MPLKLLQWLREKNTSVGTMQVQLSSALLIGFVIGLATGVILMLAIAPWRK